MRKTVKNVSEEEYKLENNSVTVKKKLSFGRSDLLPRLLSIFAALFLWFYVMSVESPTSEVAFNGVEVAVQNVKTLQTESNLSVVSGTGCVVDVVLQGKKSTLNRLSSSDIIAYVDVSDIKVAGTYQLNVKYDLPSGTTLVSSTSNTVSVYVDSTTTASIPVKVNLTDYYLEEGYELGTYSPNIEYINVTGSEAELEKITQAKVTINSLGKITDSLVATATPVLCDADGNEVDNAYITMKDTSVKVYITVYVKKNVPLTVTYKYGYFNKNNMDLNISPSSIQIKGEPSVIGQIDSINIATLDEKNLGEDTTMIEPITLPQYVLSESGESEAKITIKHKNTVKKTINVNQISVNNPNNLNYKLNSNTIRVTVFCDSSKSSLITMNTITAEVDLSSVGSNTGNITLPLTINFLGSANEYAYELGEYNISVNIK